MESKPSKGQSFKKRRSFMMVHSWNAVEHGKLDTDDGRVSKTAASKCLNALKGLWEVGTRLGKQRGKTEFLCDGAVAWP